MARETRRQRRDARRATGEQAPAPHRQRPLTAPVAGEVAAPPPVAVPGRRRGTFLRESWGELNKVEWPNRAQVIQGTVVVIIAVAIVGAYLWGADQILQRFVQNVLLGQ